MTVESLSTRAEQISVGQRRAGQERKSLFIITSHCGPYHTRNITSTL
jgi:hypothetical protein